VRESSRRSLLRFFAGSGKVYVRLGELPRLGEKELRATVPVIRPDARILLVGRTVSASLPGRKRALPLFAATPENLFVFNRLNGMNSLGTISAELGTHTGWTQPRCFAHVRSLFLHLVERRVSIHANTVARRARGCTG